MKLKIGDKIQLKPYNQAIRMYKDGALNNLERYCTDNIFVYGIDWNDYYHLCKYTGEIVDIKRFDFLVYFGRDNDVYDIPSILIQNKHGIKLPDNLFEL